MVEPAWALETVKYLVDSCLLGRTDCPKLSNLDEMTQYTLSTVTQVYYSLTEALGREMCISDVIKCTFDISIYFFFFFFFKWFIT